ncbi:hypothetical protein [Nonomuraea turkmeniaca]|uniref:hypothetical protein n=1 Tax=Nonomuraea turkmeniaca TaxID=103838 RepID=UPI001476BD91|nr:hypothetical protein [Nonomuraea turkmeniaca]
MEHLGLLFRMTCAAMDIYDQPVASLEFFMAVGCPAGLTSADEASAPVDWRDGDGLIRIAAPFGGEACLLERGHDLTADGRCGAGGGQGCEGAGESFGVGFALPGGSLLDALQPRRSASSRACSGETGR